MASPTRLASSIAREIGKAVSRPREFMDPSAGAYPSRPRLVAALVPVAAAFLLVSALSAASTDEALSWRRWAYPPFVLAALPLACAAFRLTGALLGSRVSYRSILESWGPSYWATSLFLAVLSATHFGASLAGAEPAGLPGWASFLALSLILGAAIWKALAVIGVLRFAMGLRSWRAGAGFVILSGLALAFALLSALAFGTKIPIV
jgi:hypothetical protein